MKVLPVPALASSTVVPVGSVAADVEGDRTGQNSGHRSTSAVEQGAPHPQCEVAEPASARSPVPGRRAAPRAPAAGAEHAGVDRVVALREPAARTSRAAPRPARRPHCRRRCACGRRPARRPSAAAAARAAPRAAAHQVARARRAPGRRRRGPASRPRPPPRRPADRHRPPAAVRLRGRERDAAAPRPGAAAWRRAWSTRRAPRVAVHAADGADHAGAVRRAVEPSTSRDSGTPVTNRALAATSVARRRRAPPRARRSPARPGGSSPRRHSAARQLGEVQRRPAGRAAAGRRPPSAAGRPARRAARPRGRRPSSLIGNPTPLPQELLRRGARRSVTQVVERDVVPSAPAAADPAGTAGAAPWLPAAARHPSSSARSKLNGPRAPSAPAVKLRASKGCSGWRTTTRSSAGRAGGGGRARRAARRAAPRAGGARPSARRRRCRGRPGAPSRRSTASSSSWRSSLRGSRSPTQRVAGQHVVAVVDARPRGNAPSSSPSRQTTRCGTDRIGTIVQTVRVPVRKFARVGRPRSRSASSAADVGERRAARAPRRRPAARPRRRARARACPAARRRPAWSRSARRAASVEPASTHAARAGASPEQVGERRVEPVDELGEPAGQVDVGAVDVVERQRRAEPALSLLGHRHAEQQPVQPGRPGVLRERRPAGTAPRCAASRPHRTPGPRRPRSRSRSRSSSSKPNRRRHRGRAAQVEHLATRSAARRPARAARPTTSSSGLAWRSARSASRTREPVAGVPRRRHSSSAEPERRRDQRREGLDVRAHDEDVARLQRRVVGEQAEQHLAQHLDLAVRAVAGVHLDAPVAVGEHVASGRRPVVARGRAAAGRAGSPAGRAGAGWCGRRAARPASAQLQLADVAAERGAAADGAASSRRRRRPRRAGTARRPSSDRCHRRGRGAAATGARRGARPSAASTRELVVRAAGSGRTPTAAPAGRQRRGRARARRPRSASRSAGSGAPIRARSRRHSSGCQRRSSGDLAVVVARPPRRRAARGGAWRRRRTGPARWRRPPANRACAARVRGGRPAGRTTGSARAGVDDRQQRPHRARRAATGRRRSRRRWRRPARPRPVAGGGEHDVARTPRRRVAAAVPSRCARRCASQRSTPRAGTATTSRGERVGRRLGEHVGQRRRRGCRALGPVQVQHGVTDRSRRGGVPCCRERRLPRRLPRHAT